MAEDSTSYLNIPDSLGRDIDSGKAASRDMADFLPDAVAQEMWDASHPEPVHAENLIPISPGAARELRTFDGESMPKFPSTRRVIPAPYQRDRAVGGSHGKAWTVILAGGIRPGDIIAGVGLVTAAELKIRYKSREEVVADEMDGLDEMQLRTVLEKDAGASGLMTQFAADAGVAVGTDCIVTGAGGNVAAYDSAEQVSVFRRISHGQPGT